MPSKRDVEIEMHDTMDRVIAKSQRLRASHDALLAALKGVIRVADRQTMEFDAGRAVVAAAEAADG